MPRVIDELTQEELEEIKRIDEKYKPLHDAAHKKVSDAMSAWEEATKKAREEKRPLTAEEAALGDVMNAATDEQSVLFDEWFKARNKITENAETRLFDNYRGNVDAILSMIKEEVPRHIAVTSIFAGNEPTEKERRAAERAAVKARKEIEAGIAFNREQLKSRPDDEELIKATEGLVELLETGAYKLEKPYDLAFSDDALRQPPTKVYHEFFCKIPKKAAPDAYKEAVLLPHNYIKKNKRGMLECCSPKSESSDTQSITYFKHRLRLKTI